MQIVFFLIISIFFFLIFFSFDFFSFFFEKTCKQCVKGKADSRKINNKML